MINVKAPTLHSVRYKGGGSPELHIEYSLSDQDTVRVVEFRVDGELKCTVNASELNGIQWQSLPIGPHRKYRIELRSVGYNNTTGHVYFDTENRLVESTVRGNASVVETQNVIERSKLDKAFKAGWKARGRYGENLQHEGYLLDHSLVEWQSEISDESKGVRVDGSVARELQQAWEEKTSRATSSLDRETFMRLMAEFINCMGRHRGLDPAMRAAFQTMFGTTAEKFK